MDKLKVPFLLLLFTFLITGCYNDTEEELYGEPVCNLESVTYALSIEPIISANCYACHSIANATANGSGIVLEGYSKLKVAVDNGLLEESIIHGPNASPMPKGAPKLSDCKINTIISWINNGAPNN